MMQGINIWHNPNHAIPAQCQIHHPPRAGVVCFVPRICNCFHHRQPWQYANGLYIRWQYEDGRFRWQFRLQSFSQLRLSSVCCHHSTTIGAPGVFRKYFVAFACAAPNYCGAHRISYCAAASFAWPAFFPLIEPCLAGALSTC